jgi:16S rRNA (uracil1498-N3)-methyltransferase
MPQAQPNQLAILIGPEADFTPHEVKLAEVQGFIPASLGQTILRTETAALFACMAAKSTLS